jgi:hypothetical protein
MARNAADFALGRQREGSGIMAQTPPAEKRGREMRYSHRLESLASSQDDRDLHKINNLPCIHEKLVTSRRVFINCRRNRSIKFKKNQYTWSELGNA